MDAILQKSAKIMMCTGMATLIKFLSTVAFAAGGAAACSTIAVGRK